MAEPMDALDVRVCNCALCGCLLLGESQRHQRSRLPRSFNVPNVSHRLHGRPYCRACIDEAIEIVRREAAAGLVPEPVRPIPVYEFDPFVRRPRAA